VFEGIGHGALWSRRGGLYQPTSDPPTNTTTTEQEALQDLVHWFTALDSQEHRPGTSRPGVVSPGRHGRVFHRRDILLVGTFRDALANHSIDNNDNDGDGDDDDGAQQQLQLQRTARFLEDLNLALCQRLAHFEAFARLRLPSFSRGKGRVFFAVGADPSAPGDELGPLRRALCKAVARNGALRRSRPAMWLRFLDEIRCVSTAAAAGAASATSMTSPSSFGSPPPTGPSPYRRVLSREQCRQVADRLAYEFTNRPMAPEAFALMLRLLGEMGEILVLDVDDGHAHAHVHSQAQQLQVVVLPRREYPLYLYRKVRDPWEDGCLCFLSNEVRSIHALDPSVLPTNHTPDRRKVPRGRTLPAPPHRRRRRRRHHLLPPLRRGQQQQQQQ
jgi:hypothetical protein